MKIDQASADRLKLLGDKSDLIVFDDKLPGFGMRVRAGGKRTWIVQYRVGRKQRRQTLGSLDTIQADQARKQAKDALARVQLGGDPQAAKAEQRARAAETLAVIVKLHLAAQRKDMKPRSFETIETHLNKHWSPLHRRPIREITRGHVAMRLTAIAEERGPIAAKRARATLSHLFTWAIEQGIVDDNPVIKTSKGADEHPRERVLDDPELLAIWRSCRDDDHGVIVKLLLLTGQRRDEIAAAAKSEIDLRARLLKLPEVRTKNSRAHDVHMSDLARDLFAAAMRREGREDRALIFGEGKRAFSGWSAAKLALDGRIEQATGAALKPWRLHDLRRTAATGMAKLKVLPHVIEAVLNHVSGHKAGVAGIYNRDTYDEERKQALDKWAAHIEALLAGKPASNIHPLRA